MSRSEEGDCSSHSKLIHDIGQQRKAGFSDTLSLEQQLMQHSSDPLLVREFVLSHGLVLPQPTVGLPMAAETKTALANCSFATSALKNTQRHFATRLYGEREPLREAVWGPSTFHPSQKDRLGAMDFGRRRQGSAALFKQSVWHRSIIVAMAVIFGVAGLVLVLASG
jgi:hypothetical protein